MYRWKGDLAADFGFRSAVAIRSAPVEDGNGTSKQQQYIER